MKYKYQLILLGANVPERDNIRDCFFQKLKDLKLSKEIIKVIDKDNISSEYYNRQNKTSIFSKQNIQKK